MIVFTLLAPSQGLLKAAVLPEIEVQSDQLRGPVQLATCPGKWEMQSNSLVLKLLLPQFESI
jgi:hypothetical protein